MIRRSRYEEPDPVVLLPEPAQARAADGRDGQAQDDVPHRPLGDALAVQVKQALHAYRGKSDSVVLLLCTQHLF